MVVLEKTLESPLDCKEIKPDWSWNSNTLATWCEELTHLKRPWCWERLKAGGEGDDSGWDGGIVSLTQWTWVWAISGSWWWTGRPGVLQSMGLQRVRHDWVTELNWMFKDFKNNLTLYIHHHFFFFKFLFISYLFLFFNCARSSLLCRLFSSCGEYRLLSSWGAWASHWSVFSCYSAGSRHAGFSSCSKQASVVVVHGPSCSVACRILPDQGLNLCPLHLQEDSYPLHHQGSP